MNAIAERVFGSKIEYATQIQPRGCGRGKKNRAPVWGAILILDQMM
jgi:hypothetical protein